MRPHRKGGWSGRCLWCLIRVAAPRSRSPTARWPGRAGQSAALSSATLRKPEREDNTRSTFKILVTFLGKQRTNQEQVHFLTLSWSTSPPNTQTCHDTKGQGGIAEEWLSQPKFRHPAAARAAGLESAAPERHCSCTAGTRHSTAEETDGTRAVTHGAAFTFSTRQYML